MAAAMAVIILCCVTSDMLPHLSVCQASRLSEGTRSLSLLLLRTAAEGTKRVKESEKALKNVQVENKSRIMFKSREIPILEMSRTYVFLRTRCVAECRYG